MVNGGKKLKNPNRSMKKIKFFIFFLKIKKLDV